MSSGRLATVGSFLATAVMVLACLAVLVLVALVFTWMIDRTVDLVHDDVEKHSHSATASSEELTKELAARPPGDRFVNDETPSLASSGAGLDP